MTITYLALGSNIGNKEAYIERAITLLGEYGVVTNRSPLYVSRAVGYTLQDNFINMALTFTTELEPKALLRAIKTIEELVGRIHRFRFGPREIDIDIIFYGDLIYHDLDLSIPHERMQERDFVLRPLADIAPDVIDPNSGMTVRELLKNISQQDSAIIS